MKVIHIVHGKVNPSGSNGISNVVFHLNKYEKILGIQSDIFAIVDNIKKPFKFTRGETEIYCFPRNLIHKKGILNHIFSQRKLISLIHFHIPWIFIKIPIAKKLNKWSIPYIVSGHSSYSSNQIMNLKKRIAFFIYEKSFLQKASSIRSITKEESTEIIRLVPNSKIFTVPNGVDDPLLSYKFVERILPIDKVNFLFVGELRNQKNLDGLINAISLINYKLRENLLFTIIGPDSRNNLAKLKDLSLKLGVSNNVSFVGPKFGFEKSQYFHDCDIYIQPSHSEVVSLSAIEAMAYSKPIVITRTCDVSYYNCSGSFIMCEPIAIDISNAIVTVLKNKSFWSSMGVSSRKLFESQFVWKNNVDLLIKNYSLILNKISGK